jgi:hypothetical protein
MGTQIRSLALPTTQSLFIYVYHNYLYSAINLGGEQEQWGSVNRFWG